MFILSLSAVLVVFKFHNDVRRGDSFAVFQGNQIRFVDNILVFVSCGRSNGKCWSDGVDRAEPSEGWTGVAVV